jgi:hypothetical protein
MVAVRSMEEKMRVLSLSERCACPVLNARRSCAESRARPCRQGSQVLRIAHYNFTIPPCAGAAGFPAALSSEAACRVSAPRRFRYEMPSTDDETGLSVFANLRPELEPLIVSGPDGRHDVFHFRRDPQANNVDAVIGFLCESIDEHEEGPDDFRQAGRACRDRLRSPQQAAM